MQNERIQENYLDILTSGKFKAASFEALDLNNVDNLYLSGVDIEITGSNLLVSGQSVVLNNTLSLYATTINLNSTGSTLTSAINNLSGSTVFTTGNQSILGIKTFRTGISIESGVSPQRLTVFNFTGTNTGEFGLFGWINNELVVGTQATNSGVLRNLSLTGRNLNFNSVSGNILLTSSSGNLNISPSGNVNINASGVVNVIDNVNISGSLIISGATTISGANLIVDGNTTITGHLAANSKSFLISHPLDSNKKLQYGSLEGPENGVYVRGKTNENIINLPDYWSALVDENSISVNLTPIYNQSNLYVIEYNNKYVSTAGNNGLDYFYIVYGERKDIPKLTVEF